jgi:peptide/nickel transport system substrate-binding protein
VDTTIIPLYQIKEHYAYRNTVTGIGRGIVHLYQNMERWTIDVFGSDEDETRTTNR